MAKTFAKQTYFYGSHDYPVIGVKCIHVYLLLDVSGFKRFASAPLIWYVEVVHTR